MDTIRQFLTYQDILILTGIKSRNTIWRKVKEASFPAPVRLGRNLVRWREQDIRSWIETLPAEKY
jgi:prophage regulatory protein